MGKIVALLERIALALEGLVSAPRNDPEMAAKVASDAAKLVSDAETRIHAHLQTLAQRDEALANAVKALQERSPPEADLIKRVEAASFKTDALERRVNSLTSKVYREMPAEKPKPKPEGVPAMVLGNGGFQGMMMDEPGAQLHE